MTILINSKNLIASNLSRRIFSNDGLISAVITVVPQLILWIALTFLVGASCSWKDSQIAATPVMIVNDHKLSAKDFSRALAQQLKLLDALAAKDPNHVVRSKENILSQFVVESLTTDFAKSQNIFVEEKDLQENINNYRSLYPDDLSFRRVLAEEGLSFSEWKDRLKYRLLEKKVFQKINEKNAEPSDAEIQSYYQNKKEQFQKKERIQFRQIVVAEESIMDTVVTQLKTKEFSSLARKYSIMPEEKNGGLVDWIEKGSVDYFEPLFKLKEGQLSSVFKSPFGYHIVKLEKHASAETLPLAKVRPQIVVALRATKEQALYKDWLDKQIHQSKVLRNNELIQSVNIDTKE